MMTVILSTGMDVRLHVRYKHVLKTALVLVGTFLWSMVPVVFFVVMDSRWQLRSVMMETLSVMMAVHQHARSRHVLKTVLVMGMSFL